MLKKALILIVMMVVMTVTAWAEGKYNLKTMTPEVKEALEGRKARFSELRSLKASGAIGENNRGYVEALNGSAKSVANAENRDRKVIYQTIAEQNGLQGALATIESAFAQVQRSKAESGDKVQDSEGNWTVK